VLPWPCHIIILTKALTYLSDDDKFEGRGGPGDRFGKRDDDKPTIRVTNVSEDTTEDDLKRLFYRYGE
jgi:RNA recognition motif-containing protein